jgi:hypothetical protein
VLTTRRGVTYAAGLICYLCTRSGPPDEFLPAGGKKSGTEGSPDEFLPAGGKKSGTEGSPGEFLPAGDLVPFVMISLEQNA